MNKLNLIIQHFEYLAKKKSNAKNYDRGIEITKKWIQLTTKANIDLDRLDKIIRLIKNESIPNTPTIKSPKEKLDKIG